VNTTSVPFSKKGGVTTVLNPGNTGASRMAMSSDRGFILTFLTTVSCVFFMLAGIAIFEGAEEDNADLV
jgi:hypothetical protein